MQRTCQVKLSTAPKIEYRTLKITMELDKYKVIMEAIEKMKQECPTMNNARCLELICADYLSGIKLPCE
jgi:hypothetical protein